MGIEKDIKEKAESYRKYTAELLSQMLRIKSYSSEEENVCRAIVKMCEECRF